MQTPDPDIPVTIPSNEDSGTGIPDIDPSQIPQTLPWLEMPPDLPGNNTTSPAHTPGRPAPDQQQNQNSNRPGEGNVRPIVIPVQCHNGKCTVGNVPYYYYIQVGLFRQPQNAVYLMGQLRQQGYPVIWNRVSGLIAIWVGPESTLDEAVRVQRQLQKAGYDTLLVTDRLIQ